MYFEYRLAGTESTVKALDNVLMVQSDEMRAEFSRRLNQAMKDAGWGMRGRGAHLAKITKTTPRGASKWLNGESIPRQEKLRIIANDLGVSQNWLQYEEGQKAQRPKDYGAVMEEEPSKYMAGKPAGRKLLALLSMIDSEYNAGNLGDSELSAIMAVVATLSAARSDKS
jgi:transcriptional regulator with XRE-family HTH domain